MNRHEKFDLVSRYLYPNVIKDLWFNVLEKHVAADSIVLEVGSGSGKGKQNINYPKAKRIIGIDLDQRVLENPYLDDAICGSAYEIEHYLSGQKVDVVYSHMVAEHIDDAEKFLVSQVNVLTEDGVILHSTVSKYFWVSLINNFVPEKVKNWLIKTLGSGRTSEDIFPALYQLNSEDQIKKLSEKYQLEYELIRQDEPPGYLRRSIILMVLYTLFNKPLQFLFPSLRQTFIFKLRKK